MALNAVRRESFWAAAAAVALAVSLSSCADSAVSNRDEDAGGGGGQAVKMGMSVPGPHPSFDHWERALQDTSAEYDFADSDYLFGKVWSLNESNATLNGLVSRGFNAIALFPGDPAGTNSQLESMKARGVETILLAGCTDDPSPALFCLATDVEAAAYAEAKALIEAIGGEGEIAHLSSNLTDPNTQLRADGVNRAVAETNGKVKVVQFVADIDTPDKAPPAVDSLLAARGAELDGIVSTTMFPTEALAAAIAANPQYQRIVVVGADDGPQTVQGIKDGVILGSMYQNFYGQGAVAAYVFDKVVGEGCSIRDDVPWQKHPQTTKFIDSGYALATKDNVNGLYANGADLPDKTEELMAFVDAKVLDCNS
jgi:ribose transport system substrate-binding protein